MIVVSKSAQAKILGSILQSAQHSDTIIQLARITRLVDVAFDHRTIDARRSALFDFCFLGITEHFKVDRLPSLMRQKRRILYLLTG